jgi:hypothetical protein
MEDIEILTVEECFEVGGGLLLHPNFSLPNGNWENRLEKVIIVRPDGQKVEATAQFSSSHFNYADPNISLDRRWRVTIFFPEMKKDYVPVRSKIFVSREVKEALFL